MKKITYITTPVMLAFLCLGLFLWLSSPAEVAAGACTVPGDHPTIQGAVNDVTCNIISVSAATYNENVVITRSVIIIGAGTTNTFVDGGGAGSVFSIDPGLTVHIEGLVIRDGLNPDGGGVHNDNAQLTLSDTLIINNSAGFNGGAVFNTGQATIINTRMRDNDGTNGGAVFNDNFVVLIGSNLTNNQASAFGGGVYNVSATAKLTGTDLINNGASMSGGGLYNLNGDVSIESSELNDNDALGVNGGGIFQAYISASLQINNSSFQNNSAANDGGGIYSSGGTTTISDSSIRSNSAVDNGGGLNNDTVGHLTVFNTSFVSNTATFGAGMFTSGTITVSQSFFLGNKAANQTLTLGSGGAHFHAGNGQVETSNYRNNTAFFAGGAVANLGNLTIRQTTADGNNTMSGTGQGGGIGNAALMTIEDSTISNNASIDGGGLVNFGVLTMLNSTVSGNSANGGGGLQNRGTSIINYSTFYNNTAIAGGGILALMNLVDLNSSLIALNPSGGDCQLAGGVIASLDYNLDSDNTCNLVQPNDLPGTAPLLGPLQNNGGWTATNALLPGSPGIDAGDPGSCPSGDQRGFPRPIGPGCDIGAYEAGMVVYLPVTRKP